MKRLPLLIVFVFFIALCASAAYWAMQLFKPPVRAVAAPPPVKSEPRIDAAAALFGGRESNAEVATNVELRGVIAAGAKNSIAIIAADGKPAQPIGVNTELSPGVTVKEVHPQYILLVQNGVTKRVDLPESAKGQDQLQMVTPPGTAAPVAPTAQPTMPRQMPPPQPELPQPAEEQAPGRPGMPNNGMTPGGMAPGTASGQSFINETQNKGGNGMSEGGQPTPKEAAMQQQRQQAGQPQEDGNENNNAPPAGIPGGGHPGYVNVR